MRALVGNLICISVSLISMSRFEAYAADPAVANSAAAPTSTSLATVEALAANSKMTINKIARKNNVVTVKGIVENVGTEVFSTTFEPSEMFLLNEEKGIKYFPLVDEDKRPIVSQVYYGGLYLNIKGGESSKFWVKFTAPPAEIKTVNLVFEGFEIIESVPITDEG